MKSFFANTPGYKRTGIFLDIAKYRRFRPGYTGTTEITKRNLMKMEFRNKCLDSFNISNILYHKDVKAAVSPYFKDQNSPLISNSYMPPMAT